MKKVKTKIISAVLVILTLFSLFSLTSCNRKFDEDEVEEITKKLLKEAEMLNKVYYGSGIRYHESDIGKGNYRRAEQSHLEELGFYTVSELMTLTEKTFSDSYSSLLYSTILSALTDDSTLVNIARYYQATDEETGESYMMVNSKFNVMFKDTLEYDFDSVRAEKSKKEKVYVSVDATVTNSEGKSQKVTITVTLVEEEDGWKIDGPTYANYNELSDKYDKLKDQEIK